MVRKLQGWLDTGWANPLKDLKPKPYLQDETWPMDPRSRSWERAYGRLARFYCGERRAGNSSAEQLRSYLADPVGNFIVWGDVGIGKTWFVRYEMYLGPSRGEVAGYHPGVIDMLRGGGSAASVYKQLTYAVEGYLNRFCGGVSSGLRDHIIYDLAALHNKDRDDLGPDELAKAEKDLALYTDLRARPTQAAAINYVGKLLDSIESGDRAEPLVLLLDNIDKAHEDRIAELLDIAVPILVHPKMRLIIPLRLTSELLLDRFGQLTQYTNRSMVLGPLDLRLMLYRRFQLAGDGRTLSGAPVCLDPLDGRKYTFPRVFTLLFGQDPESVPKGGKLVLSLAGNNARSAINLTNRLLYSDQIKGVKRIGRLQYAIAALMLTDYSEPAAKSTSLVNLFNDEQPGTPGNALIRFRVLEWFWHSTSANTSEERFSKHFLSLGYDQSRVKRVLKLFLQTQLIASREGLGPDEVTTRTLEEIGELVITETGQELRNTVKELWYIVSVKKDVYLPEAAIHEDQTGRQYCLNRDFVVWLEAEETRERLRSAKYAKQYGRFAYGWKLEEPHLLARQVLWRRAKDRSGEGADGGSEAPELDEVDE